MYIYIINNFTNINIIIKLHFIKPGSLEVVPSHIHPQKEKRKKEKKKEIERQVSLNVMKPSFTEFGNS